MAHRSDKTSYCYHTRTLFLDMTDGRTMIRTTTHTTVRSNWKSFTWSEAFRIAMAHFVLAYSLCSLNRLEVRFGFTGQQILTSRVAMRIMLLPILLPLMLRWSTMYRHIVISNDKSVLYLRRQLYVTCVSAETQV